MSEDRDPDASMSDQHTFQGKAKSKLDDLDTRSIGDQATFAGGRGVNSPKSLGDQATFGGAGGDDDNLDDDMEVVDLEARYKIEKTLGKGGMGEVLLATDTRLDRKVAIKRILGDAARSRTAVNRFLTEAKSIAALNHPNVVQIYDYGRAKDGPFLIMEFVDGSSLLDRCREGAIPVEEAVDLVCQLCDGLGRAHAAGIIHRDIKPANVLLTADGIPKLTDFGLAKAEKADTGMTMAGAVLGTLDFMPPEQRRDAALTDARSDLWSLAATLYQMVTGESPKVIRIKKVPLQLQDVLDKALEDSKEGRYQTAKELRAALKDCLKVSQRQVPQIAADLGTGECPSCHSVNESHRKFCRECGETLRCKCLKCEHEIPVWDKVCPECGGKQAEMATSIINEYGERRQRAEQLRSNYQYQSALELVERIAAVTDRRIAVHTEWAKEFVQNVKTDWDHEKNTAQEHYTEAKKHREAFDYDAAIRTIEAIPDPLRNKEISSLLTKLKSDQKESSELLTTIKDRIARRELDGLLQTVERAIKLQGDQEDLRVLRGQLQEREQKLAAEQEVAFKLADSLFAEGKAKEALKLLVPYQETKLINNRKEIIGKLKRIVVAENQLVAMVKEANADGVIDSDEIVAMLPMAIEYLKLNPQHSAMKKLRDDLISRLENVPDGTITRLEPQVLSELPTALIKRLSRSSAGLVNSIGMKLNLIPAGRFVREEDGKKHDVIIKNPYYLGAYEVTQEQYERVMNENPSRFKNAQHPVESISWKEANLFCERLSSLPEEVALGYRYRLPTAEEWEYACRAGTTTKFSFKEVSTYADDVVGHSKSIGGETSNFTEFGWNRENSSRSTHPVGQLRPNPWGLYDMHGNVAEWCNSSSERFPESFAVYGGSWQSTRDECSSSSHSFLMQHLVRSQVGFRIVCEL